MYTIYYIKRYNFAIPLSGLFLMTEDLRGKIPSTQLITFFMSLRNDYFVV
jgi:hypothetical protein